MQQYTPTMVMTFNFHILRYSSLTAKYFNDDVTVFPSRLYETCFSYQQKFSFRGPGT